MAELIFPDAGQWINALEAGQQAGMTQRRSAAATSAGGKMSAGDYQGAAADLYGAGDIQSGVAISRIGADQATQAHKLARQQAVQQKLAAGDIAGAYEDAGTDADLIGALDKVAAHSKETTATLAGALQALKDPATGQWLPPDLARARYLEIKPTLQARGIDPRMLDGFDPTPANLEAIQGQVLGLQEQLKMAAPKVVGKSLVTPQGKPLYTDPTYEKVGDTETLVEVGGGGGSEGGGAAAPTGAGPAPGGGFDAVYHGFVAPHEGGYTAHDGNGSPANFGINQGANPEVDVSKLTPQAAQKILHDKYWVPSGAEKLPPALQAIQFDTAVNMGVGAAQNLLQQSGGDPAAYLKLREERYRAIAAADPSKASKLPVWLARNADLSAYVSGQGGGAGAELPGGAKVIFAGSPKGAGENDINESAIKLQASKYLQTGVVPPFGMGRSGTMARNKFYNEAAKQADELHLSSADLVSGAYTTKALGASMTQMQKSLEATQSYEKTALANGELMLSLAPKGGGQTGIPVLNRWLQAGRKQIAGDPDVTKFDNAIGAFSEEYAKVMTGNLGNVAATDGARKDASERLAKYAAQDQLTQGYDVMKQEMENRNHAQEAQVAGIQAKLRAGITPGSPQDTPGAGTTAAPKANPQASWTAPQQAAAKRADANAAPGSQGNPFVPTTEAQYKKLPKGAHYIFTDGRVMVKGG
jgi:hypothetical protein